LSDVTIHSNAVAAAGQAQDIGSAVQTYIMHHMSDSRRWSWLPAGHQDLPVFLTVHGIMVILSALLLVYMLLMVCRKVGSVPHGLLNMVEFFVQFIRDEMAVPFLGEEDGRKLTPLLCSLFFFILMMNLLGLIPCFYTATANINVTGALAGVTLAVMIFGAIARNGLAGFFKGFVPHGIPWPVLIIVVPVEMIGLLVKSMALAIRLFANELAGHIVVFSLLGMLVMFGMKALPVFAMALVIYLLEVFVAFLQAYIFTLLSAVFIGQRYHPAH
jgi:F-type H+-transporting ATPase subunit a